MYVGVGILSILLDKDYVLCIRISMPPLEGVYGNPQRFIHLVGVLALLKMNVYLASQLCKYLVDLIAIILVFWRIRMVGWVCG
jgi:hypothetical protein